MNIRGITLDTGALVAIERRKQRGTHLLEHLHAFFPTVRVLSCSGA
jgi:hypothetical protein